MCSGECGRALSPRAAKHFNHEAFSYYRRLARVHRFVVDRNHESFDLSEVALVARMERSSFSDFFHRKTGVRYSDWLAAVRVSKAIDLMSVKNLPIREVARRSGFGTVRTFQRTFLKLAGQSPVAYKQSVRPS